MQRLVVKNYKAMINYKQSFIFGEVRLASQKGRGSSMIEDEASMPHRRHSRSSPRRANINFLFTDSFYPRDRLRHKGGTARSLNHNHSRISCSVNDPG